MKNHQCWISTIIDASTFLIMLNFFFMVWNRFPSFYSWNDIKPKDIFKYRNWMYVYNRNYCIEVLRKHQCLIIVAKPNTSNKEILKSYNVVYKVVAKTINGLQQNLLNNAFKHIMCFSSSIMQECIVLLYL